MVLDSRAPLNYIDPSKNSHNFRFIVREDFLDLGINLHVLRLLSLDSLDHECLGNQGQEGEQN